MNLNVAAQLIKGRKAQMAARYLRTFLAAGLVAGVMQGVVADVKAAVTFKDEPFPLTDVRLLEGPFKTAMERDAAYLLATDTDRLLHNFRVNAKLPSQAEPLGNWERPISELRGHFTGHYLSACALMYASTGDVRFKERADLLVRELAKCQAALGPSGYLSAFPETFFDRLEAHENVWAPYYTVHKIFAGLLDAQALCGNAQALDVAAKLGDWVVARTSRLSDAQLQKALETEHGGINESMAELYARTGKEVYLQAARRLCHTKVFDPLAARVDKLSGLHANTQFPKIIGAARLYEVTGDVRYRDIAEFFWDRVVNHHSYVTGGNSDHESFGPPDTLNDRVSPFTAESCNTYNMLKLSRQLFAWDASAERADFCERALYNHILATQDPRTGRMAYHIPLYGGWIMPYDTPDVSCWCCTGTGMENHARYGESIFFRDAEGLFVNLFIPSQLTWREKGVSLRMETRYPEETSVRLTVTCEKPTTFAVRVRCPAWAGQDVAFFVNGARATCNAKPGGFATVAREWRDGDRVEWTIPMRLRLVPMPDNPARAAICYGSIVLAGELGTANMEPPKPYAVKQSDFFTAKDTPPPMPVLLAAGRPVEEWVEPVAGRPLTFRTKGVGQPKDIELVAFYTLPPQRFSLYWDILTPAQWQAEKAAQAKRAQLERERAERTLDAVVVGNAKSEQSHNLQSERSHAGTFSNRPYRDAATDGWFSYDFKVPAARPVVLLCTFWGSDAGARIFDVLANGTPIATVKLNHNRPGEFYDEVIAIPEAVLAGKQKVEIRLRGQPGNMAGGVFDVRLVRGD